MKRTVKRRLALFCPQFYDPTVSLAPCFFEVKRVLGVCNETVKKMVIGTDSVKRMKGFYEIYRQSM